MSGRTVGPVGRIVAANVRNLRADRGLTKQALADRCTDIGRPIPVLGIARIEEHARRVDADDLVVLAMVFGIEPGQLLTAPACDKCFGAPAPWTRCLACGTEASDAAISVEAPAQPVPARRRNRLTDKHLRAVAEAYCAADRDGLPPTRTVADRFAVPHSTAAKWVGHARKRELLGEATSGAEAQT